MASTDNGKQAKAQRLAASQANRQVIRQKITDLLKTHFASSLGTVKDIVNLVMALVHRESGFNPAANSGSYGSKHEQRVLNYSAVKTKYTNGSAQERANIKNAVSARGLMQCTGYYILKGAGATGVCELQRMRPDLVASMLLPIGADVGSKLNGESTIDNQLLAGLIVLEDKYKNVAPKLVASGKYNDRITAAIAAYLGLGAADKFGTTPQAYADSIIRGSSYRIANSGVGTGEAVTNSGNTTEGPVQTAASGKNLGPAGC